MLLIFAISNAAEAQYTYTTNNGTITITRYTGFANNVFIPSTINGLPVTGIGESAFSSTFNLGFVDIPYGVTTIGGWAFQNCTNLSTVEIPSSVTSIGSNAFQDCTSLSGVEIPAVTNISSGTFYNCNRLVRAWFYSGVTAVGDGAFYNCASLIGVYFVGNAPSAGTDVFIGASNATVYYLPGTAGWGATFGGRPTSVWGYGYTTNNGTITITWYRGPGGDVIIPDTINDLPVTRIGDQAFRDHWGVRSVTIPNSVTTIGDAAFVWCTGLIDITIPDSVVSIGKSVFGVCTRLTAITVDSLNPVYSSVDGALFNKDQTTLIAYPAGRAGGYTIPETVTTIGEDAFRDSSLTNVVIPNGVTSIGFSAFAFSKLTSVTIPDGVTSIAANTFVQCTSLKDVVIPSRVTNIGDGAFAICYSLPSLMIPSSVTNIGDRAFVTCRYLTGVYFQGNAPSLGGSAVFEDSTPIVYYLPGTTGWGSTFGGRPTALWSLPHPMILDFGPSFGVQTNAFGFTVSWATNAPVVVEASTDLAIPVWSPVATNILTGGSSYFSDPQWTNHPARFYRLRSP